MEDQKPNYFSILPATVRYDNELTPNAKLLFSEITCLSNMNGFCSAGDGYFCWLYNVDTRSIQKWLKQLVEYGYITIIKRDKKRMIYPNMNPLGNGINIPVEETDRNIYSDKPEEKFHVVINNNNNYINNLPLVPARKELYREYEFFTQEFYDVWKEFREMRQKKKQPMTLRAEKLNLNDISKYSGNETGTAIKLVEQSLKGGWTGIYELKHRQDSKDPKGIEATGERKDFS